MLFFDGFPFRKTRDTSLVALYHLLMLHHPRDTWISLVVLTIHEQDSMERRVNIIVIDV